MARNATPPGTENVLFDLGFEDAEELSAKALLAFKINELVDRRHLKQSQVADLIGMSQPKVSHIRNYKLLNISLERLMIALVSLDQHVEISVRPARRSLGPGISVST
ncbi:helix-turn-helix domain-containing protein [Pinirhizobacter soli]|uniref:helix-turn-helix domain-containing protein n=1 Tax=Pinirhizobacter soli TaxID=2786953 RepID=UPI00202A95CB|nr:helix-turn-helix transcriptional regulator [Pinirhizobacter soli]